MNKFRDKVSTAVGIRIPENGYSKVFRDLEIMGALDQRLVHKLLVIMLETIDELDRKETDLQS